jgi:hypothetical protein
MGCIHINIVILASVDRPNGTVFYVDIVKNHRTFWHVGNLHLGCGGAYGHKSIHFIGGSIVTDRSNSKAKRFSTAKLIKTIDAESDRIYPGDPWLSALAATQILSLR